MEKNTRSIIKFAFGFIMLVLGLVLNHLNIGSESFTFGSVGNWLLYIGFMSIILSTIMMFSKKEKLVDERMQFVATKANRITFLIFITGSFGIMILDGIKAITMPYHLFMSYLVCGMIFVYFVAYKILLRLN